jgi:hypothetical protein
MKLNLEYNHPYLKCNLPKEICKEIEIWTKECKKIKSHPLAELKSHENVGYLPETGNVHNSYQCSLPTNLIENSFWLLLDLALLIGEEIIEIINSESGMVILMGMIFGQILQIKEVIIQLTTMRAIFLG